MAGQGRHGWPGPLRLARAATVAAVGRGRPQWRLRVGLACAQKLSPGLTRGAGIRSFLIWVQRTAA